MQKQEAAATDKASPESNMQVSREITCNFSGVQNVAPLKKSQPSLEQQPSHNSSPSFEPVLPMPLAGQVLLKGL
jgi:hypothetical protein